MRPNATDKPKVKFKMKVNQAGSSLKVTIPKPIVRALTLKAGDLVCVYLENHKIIIEPERKQNK